MADLFSTNVLTGVVNSLQTPPTWLLGRFFGATQTEQSEEIHFDVEADIMGLAPFVSPMVEGAVVTDQGYVTKTFKPAYIKPKSPWEPSKALKRTAGEPIGGNLSPDARMQLQLNTLLRAHREMIQRRLEWMAAQVLRLGTITVTGDKYPSTLIDFGRDGLLTATLAGGAKWTDTGVDPLANLQTWAELVFAKSGSFPVDVVLDLKAWNIFKNNDFVKARINLQRAATQAPSLTQNAVLQTGAVLMGNVDGFNIWAYHGVYKDSTGTQQKMLPDYTCLMVGDMMGVQAYGAILDEEAGMQALPFFAKSWVTQDPSRRWIMTQSSPLLVPYRPNASLCMTIHS